MDSDEVKKQWETRSGEYSPAYYAHHGPDETSETLREIFERFLDADAAILELGCGSGRHLAHLHEHGFERLSGIDLNGDSFDVMAETYPGLASAGTFHHGAIEAVVEGFEDGRFDAVYSVETLQHIHPDVEWVFEEIARITGDVLVTVENEGEADIARSAPTEVNYVTDDVPLYYRNWRHVFDRLGFVEVDAERGKRDTLRAFRRA
ncbi:probable S-adenosylmethionine-dependent methyltransferase [Natronomonas moolapensis 8.8.11]|uniref:Probable S-adenosylmethionine-dependent methyltransferase n=1 Tax=Natronomonas moolapensis (strain DSM 18674 / CECT 7526 / JCM 14361 / 8.8.11) TaxID=268739 RepID=M1XQ74_NATM8|nr:class I SAM-dependent methyltransferase [Natronomonas moolapensis]CCQ36268.1 probable S-adenosylmethionine-dependent methyltransferase [Natronomonas moolapensis 8.8.11]